jgi:hypothetical protein
VPATRAAHNKFLFFGAAVYSTKEANKAGLKQSIFLDVYVVSNYGLFTLAKFVSKTVGNSDTKQYFS